MQRLSTGNVLLFLNLDSIHAFVHTSFPVFTPKRASGLFVKPSRLPDNVDGVLYVNDQCINCAACSQFAPQSFARSEPFHVVYRQPQSALEIQQARQALLACPVAAIRVETKGERQKRRNDSEWKETDQELVDQLSGKDEDGLAFPRPFLDDIPDVYWVGHHNSASFGAIPYLFQTPDHEWIMVDTPKYGSAAVQGVTSLTGPQGPNYLVLTHVDDTADHRKWADHFAPHLQRIFHSGDLGQHNWLGDTTLEDVEILLENSPSLDELTVFSLNGTRRHEVDWATLTEPVILHTPGHSPGSISLFHNAGADCKILFSGDTYAFSTRTNTMTGFPRYGHDRKLQAKMLEKLIAVNFTVVAPGHGHPRDYRGMDPQRRYEELLPALKELRNG
ncbi:hypothetical protein FisN_14Lh251 [Fistulifera solaris]|uniref:Metallo-beta-lactamase domain-containing protein n=1 Tax=Fistulifera solaris TaxID=1519565 RepID=A0A1Z5JAE5_FISSO|nr:hypothetical protein FisN_14Lh251 [Fistulifera solaris]|eukprot:GAX10731.1 hypothetical protein FisN_14Lh251 [Fistulifera solaris]